MMEYRRQTATTPETLDAQIKAASVILASLQLSMPREQFAIFLRDLGDTVERIGKHPASDEMFALISVIWSIKRQMTDLSAENQTAALIERLMRKS